MAKKKKKQQLPWKKIGIAAAIVVLLVILGLFYRGGAGKAIYIGDEPYMGGVIDLTVEESVTFTTLPDETTIEIKTPSLFGEELPLDYSLALEKVDDLGYSFTIGDQQDTLFGQDRSLVYLDEEDDIPDLEISYQNNQITITNLHFVPPAAARIALYYENGTSYKGIITVDPETEFIAIVNASSTAAPELDTNLGNLSQKERGDTFTSGVLNWTTPADAGPVTLDLTAAIGGQESHAFYTMAVDGVVYVMEEEGFPKMKVKYYDYDAGKALLTVTFRPTTDLQPFAAPCDVMEVSPPHIVAPGVTLRNKRTFFSDVENVKAAYYYDSSLDESIQSYVNIPTINADFYGVESLKGYFVELVNAEETIIQGGCNVRQYLPPQMGSELRRKDLEEGWNLISLPGVKAQSLKDFIPRSDFTLFSCSQDYLCDPLASNTALQPGKPYWVHVDNDVVISYRVEE